MRNTNLLRKALANNINDVDGQIDPAIVSLGMARFHVDGFCLDREIAFSCGRKTVFEFRVSRAFPS